MKGDVVGEGTKKEMARDALQCTMDGRQGVKPRSRLQTRIVVITQERLLDEQARGSVRCTSIR